MKIRCKLLHPDAVMPRYQTDGAAGMDLVSVETDVIHRGIPAVFATGVSLEIPSGFYASVLPRSGLAKKGVLAATGVIDSDYRGAIGVTLLNLTSEPVTIRAGDRIAQLVISPVVRAELEDVGDGTLSETVRGVGGFGSTGL